MGERVMLLGGLGRRELLDQLAAGVTQAGSVPWSAAICRVVGSDRLGRHHPVVLDHVLEALGTRPEHQVFRHRMVLARLAQVERAILVLPMAPSHWFALGLLWRVREADQLPMALLVPDDHQEPLEDLPVALEALSLVTSEPQRVLDWANGMLFTNLLPPTLTPNRYTSPHPRRTH